MVQSLRTKSWPSRRIRISTPYPNAVENGLTAWYNFVAMIRAGLLTFRAIIDMACSTPTTPLNQVIQKSLPPEASSTSYPNQRL